MDKPPEPNNREPKFKWQDALGVIGALLAIGGMSDMPLVLRILCFAACAVCLPISFSSHKSWSISFRWFASIAVVFLMVYVSWAAIEKSSEHIPTAQENGEATARALEDQRNKRTAVELDCEMESLPIHIQAFQGVYVLPLSRSRMSGPPMGFMEVKNDSMKESLWPQNMPKLDVHKPPNMGKTIYGCTVSNRGDTKLFDVVLKFNLNFANPTTYEYPIVVNPLVPGEPFKFYFVNVCPIVVSTIPQTTYTALILGENERRQYPLELPKKSILGYLMPLGPAQVNWTGDRCN